MIIFSSLRSFILCWTSDFIIQFDWILLNFQNNFFLQIELSLSLRFNSVGNDKNAEENSDMKNFLYILLISSCIFRIFYVYCFLLIFCDEISRMRHIFFSSFLFITFCLKVKKCVSMMRWKKFFLKIMEFWVEGEHEDELKMRKILAQRYQIN